MQPYEHPYSRTTHPSPVEQGRISLAGKCLPFPAIYADPVDAFTKAVTMPANDMS